MRSLIILLCGAAALAFPARAEEPAPAPSDAGRFQMTPAEGGFLRLDKQTGMVSFCTVKDGLSVCRASADERSALEAEIARLAQENAELKAKLKGLPPAGSGGLPSEEEFERSLNFAERFMRRMMKLFREEARPETY